MISLVDANVLSEPTKETADSRVVAWLHANESNLIVGVKTFNPFESSS